MKFKLARALAALSGLTANSGRPAPIVPYAELHQSPLPMLNVLMFGVKR